MPETQDWWNSRLLIFRRIFFISPPFHPILFKISSHLSLLIFAECEQRNVAGYHLAHLALSLVNKLSDRPRQWYDNDSPFYLFTLLISYSTFGWYTRLKNKRRFIKHRDFFKIVEFAYTCEFYKILKFEYLWSKMNVDCSRKRFFKEKLFRCGNAAVNFFTCVKILILSTISISYQ